MYTLYFGFCQSYIFQPITGLAEKAFSPIHLATDEAKKSKQILEYLNQIGLETKVHFGDF